MKTKEGEIRERISLFSPGEAEKRKDNLLQPAEKAGQHFHWPPLSDSQEEEILRTLRLFAKALSYELAPLLESIRSNAELLGGGEEGKIRPHRRLYHIIQQSMLARQILEKVQHLSTLNTRTVHSIEMLDLETTRRAW